MAKRSYRREPTGLTKREKETPKGPSPLEQIKMIRKVLPQDIVLCASKTEKSMRVMEKNNTLVFECDIKANRTEIRDAIEKLYSVKPKKVNTVITFKGKKKAYAIFGKEHNAVEIASNADII